MKIVIAGAGSIGFHLANLLEKENQDITLIDNNADVLEAVANKLDVMTLHGNATSIDVLKEAEVAKASLFIAVTTSQETNLLTAILAKQKGAKTTIARVNNPEFLNASQKSYFATIGIDHIISPNHLAANEIQRLIQRVSLTDIFDFENGKISVAGFTIDGNSPLVGKTIRAINEGEKKFDYRGVALLRNHTTIIPKSHTVLQKGDHLYLSIKSEYVDNVLPFLGRQKKDIKKVMIVGDTTLALNTAAILQKDYYVTVVVKKKSIANEFVKILDKALVIIGDPGSKELLEQEGLAHMDAFIAVTPNTEINILSSLLAEDIGVYKTIALVDNEVYTHISQNIGIDTIINKKLIAANNIFRYVRKGSIEAIATLHGVNAEIIEFEITKENHITRKTLGELNLSVSSVIIAGVIRGDESIIPGSSFVLQKGDKVIVFALPESIKHVESYFH
jgi:trk system potassium uptake protein TrkA